MNLHRLAEERSVELHRVIAERVERDPGLVDLARKRVRQLSARGLMHPSYAARWEAILSQGLPELLAFLVDRSEEARELRQVTPFAGVVPPRERWRIWKDVRHRALRDA